MFLKAIEKSEVLNIIIKFKNYTATGFDKISVTSSKDISTHISEPLVYVLNLCIKKFFLTLKVHNGL